KKFSFSTIVRITADCPLIDPQIVDLVIEKFKEQSFDYGTNCFPRTFPYGTEVEVFSFKSLKKAWKNAKKPSEREHVFPYIQFNPHLFKITSIKNKTDHSYIRCTIDRNEDLKFVREIIKRIPTP
ncbi:MAG: acylneuraminate cytidylyltransferase, partial [Thaumarchaeota archaeon]|nr:acylneuraminate cytidylyltransferase [Nitrososphaerota archaeon]